MDESTYDRLASEEMLYIEGQFDEVDPDEVEVTSSSGVLKLELKDGVTIVLNTQRPARQLWLAAVASAWHFDYDETDGRWRNRENDELRETIRMVIKERIDLDVSL
jgi:CyaY protein